MLQIPIRIEKKRPLKVIHLSRMKMIQKVDGGGNKHFMLHKNVINVY